jgi:hypothetical protein
MLVDIVIGCKPALIASAELAALKGAGVTSFGLAGVLELQPDNIKGKLMANKNNRAFFMILKLNIKTYIKIISRIRTF